MAIDDLENVKTEETIHQVLQDGSIAGPLLEEGSAFLHFIEKVKEAYTDLMFATRPNEKDLREDIYTRMNVIDDILNTVVTARDQSRIVADRLDEDNDEEYDKE